MMALFRSDSSVTKELCVTALFNLLCDSQSRIGLMREEVIWSFTRLVMSDFASDELRRISARMLCNMSSIPAARPVLIDQRAIQAVDCIVKAVGGSDKAGYIRRCCAIVCRNISFDCPTPLKVLREGLMEAIQGLCTAGEPSTIYQIGAAVGNFSCLPDCGEYIAKNEGVAVMLHLCNSEKPALLRFMSVAMANMTALPSMQRTLVDERIVAALVICSDTKNYGQIRLCVQAFYNLTCSTDPLVRIGVVDSGVGRALSSIVNASLHTKEDVAAIKASGKNKYPPALGMEREAVLFLVAAGLCNLSQVEDCRAGLAEAHVPALIVRMLEQSRRADVIILTLNAFAALSCRRSDLPRFINAGASSILVDLSKMGLEGAPLDAVQRRRPVITGATQPLVATLTIRRLILRCLLNLSHDVESRIRQVGDGVLETSLTLAGFSSIVLAAKRSEKTAALAPAPAPAPKAAPAADKGKGGKEVGKGTEGKASETGKGKGSSTARSGVTSKSGGSKAAPAAAPPDSEEELEEEEEGKLSESEDGGSDAEPESHTSEAVEEELAEAAVRVLWNITRPGANATNAAMLREGGVAALMLLCKHPNPVIENAAAVALKNLSEDRPRRKRLGELGVVPVLTAVVKGTKVAHTKDAATVALRNITAEGGGDASDALVADAGVEMLVRLMMAGGGDAAAEGAAEDGRAARTDDPKTNTMYASRMLPPGGDMRGGIPDGVGFEEGYHIASTDASKRPKWLSVAVAPSTALNEPFVAGMTIETDDKAAAQATTDDSGGSDSDESDGKGREASGGAGEYPDGEDLDVLLDSKMWTKVGGGSLAETGLTAPRLIREEEAQKVAAGGKPGSADSTGGPLVSVATPPLPTTPHSQSQAPPMSPGFSKGASLRSGSPSVPLKPVTRSPAARKSGTEEAEPAVKPKVAPGIRQNPLATNAKLSPITRQ